MNDEIIHGDALEELGNLADDSIDLIATDPPYGYSFMGKDWDRAVPSVEIWRECLRVLKPGGFAFVMSAPRSDVQMHMIQNLTEAGFRMDFTPIYWTYASGFPKASNIGKLVDKRNGRHEQYTDFGAYLKERRTAAGLSMVAIDKALGTNTAYSWWEGRLSGVQLPTKAYYLQLKGLLDLDDRFDELIERVEAEREILATRSKARAEGQKSALPTVGAKTMYIEVHDTAPATDQAKALDGSYAGFQPKPAVEVILVAMKPLSEKTFVDQALANGKGITWLDDVRVPTDGQVPGGGKSKRGNGYVYSEGEAPENAQPHNNGRFPANLLVSDDVLGDHSRFFDLDAWANGLHPFIAVPKASKSEKNEGLSDFPEVAHRYQDGRGGSHEIFETEGSGRKTGAVGKNHHPTVKPLKLMSYLVTLGSRKDDVVLDPFLGSGTTALAAKLLGRKYIGIELETEYVEIARARLAGMTQGALL